MGKLGSGIMTWFQIGKGVRQGCILSACLFNFYAEYIMRNAGLKEAEAGIKIAGRNINNLRYADDTTLMAETEEQLKNFFFFFFFFLCISLFTSWVLEIQQKLILWKISNLCVFDLTIGLC